MFLPPSSRNAASPGFTLPLVLIVLSFAIVVVVAFAATLRVETQVSLNYKRQYEARQNALYAMRLALGRLQETAGRDQAVTARSDILEKTATPLANRYWTGVWDVRGDDPYTPANAIRTGGALDPAKRPPEWLISSTGTPDPTQPAASLSPLGLITLVGTNSATSVIQAGLIETPAKGPLAGRCAFWVGDEGVKARVNLVDPGSGTARDLRQSFMTAQRFGVESMSGLADYPVNASKLGQVIRNTQLTGMGLDAADLRARYFDITPYSSGVLSNTKEGGLKKDLTHAFELDDTGFAALLSNSGSLPESLPSFYLAQGKPDFADDASAHRITPFSPEYRTLLGGGESAASPATAFPWERGPTWELLRSFYRLKDAIVSNQLPIRKKTATQQGVYPIITRVILNVHPGLGAAASSGAARKARVYLDVQVALWNPYNIATAPGAYHCELVLSERAGGVTFQHRLLASDPWTPATSASGTVSPNIVFDNVVPSKFLSSAPEPSTSTRFGAYSFAIADPGLAPGETKIFSIPAALSGSPYSSGLPLVNQDLLARGLVYAEKGSLVIADGAQCRLIRGLIGGGYDSLYSLGLREGAGVPTSPDTYNQFDQYLYRVKFLETGYVDSEAGRATNPVVLSSQIPWDAAGYDPGEKLVFQYLAADGSTHRVNNAADWSPFGKWLAFHDPRAPFQANDPNTVSLRRHAYHEAVNYGSQWASLGGYPQVDTDTSGKLGFFGSGSTLANGSPTVALFDVPRPQTGVISLGALQHAQVASLAQAGAYVIGSSLASPILESTEELLRKPDSSSRSPAFVDLAYFLNEALFDGYFFSTIPPALTDGNLSDSAFTLPNSRLKFHQAREASELTSLNSAAHLMCEGAFNINSTSVEAWAALLSSLLRLSFSPALSPEPDPLQNPYSRLAYPLGGSDSAGANPHANDWKGYRQLSSGQIRTLAEKIVAQIRLRGPFVSLAHFVNRQLAASAAGERGVLEQALADAGTNGEIQARSPLAQTPRTTDGYNAALFAGPAFQGAPGWLTQGDLLQALAPVLTPRSDTFVIRAYGEVLAATGSPPPLGRAYCEAVVQRTPEFVDANNPPETPVSISNSRETIDLQPNPALTAINRELGRKFRIVSFRWLDENDL